MIDKNGENISYSINQDNTREDSVVVDESSDAKAALESPYYDSEKYK